MATKLEVKKIFCLEMDQHTAELLRVVLKNQDTPQEVRLIPEHDKPILRGLETLLTASLNKERG